MKRQLIFLSLVSCAIMIMPADTEAALFNGRLSDAFHRLRCNSRQMWNRIRNSNDCDTCGDQQPMMETEGEPTPAPAPATEEATPDAPEPVEATPAEPQA